MKKIIVTGASGFIGSHCLPLLVDSGYNVIAVSRRTNGNNFNQVILENMDLLDRQQIRQALEKHRPEYLLHLAWYAEPGVYWESNENTKWLEASISLVEEFIKNGGKRAVFAGTCAEYDWQYDILDDVSTPLNPSTLYGQCKLALQQAIEKMAQSHDFSYAWGRLFYLYGNREHINRLIPSVCLKLLHNEYAKVTEGRQRRDYMHVKDAAYALVKLLASDTNGPVNICTGTAIKIREIVFELASILNKQELVQYGAVPSRQDEPDVITGTTGLLKKSIDWQPMINLHDGLTETVEYWRQHR